MRESKKYLSLLLVLGMAACGGDGGAPGAEGTDEPAATQPAAAVSSMELPAGVTAEMVARGEALFTGAGLCFTCHVQGGVGGPLAPDLTDEVWINIDGSFESIVQNVITGVSEPKEHEGIMLPKGGSMITDEEVRAVAAYVWTLSHGG